MPCRIEVVIEEVVLHGFPPIGHTSVRDAIERELESLVRAGGLEPLRAGARDAERVDGGRFTLGRLDAQGIGAGVAGCVRTALAETAAQPPRRRIDQPRPSSAETSIVTTFET
jgi:hypothetical protein